MVDGNAYGMNWQGLYDPELIEYYGSQWRERAPQFSETVKLVVLAGRYAIDTGHGQHYAMARNLAYELRPGLRRRAGRLRRARDADAAAHRDRDPRRGRPAGGVHRPGAGDDRQHRPVRRHRAPGHARCRPGWSTGCPAGLMIVGRHFDDATCLRVAHAFEQAVGGLPGRPRPRPWGAGRERRPRPRRHGRPRPGRRRGERAGLARRVGEGGLRRCSRSRSRAGFFGVDQFRYGIEQMHPAEYLASPLLRALGAHRRALRDQGRGARPGRARARARGTTSSTPTSRCPTRKNPELLAFVDAAVKTRRRRPAASPTRPPGSRSATGSRVTDRQPARAHPQAPATSGARPASRHRPRHVHLPRQRGQRPRRRPAARLHRPLRRRRAVGRRRGDPNASVYFDVWEPYLEPAESRRGV